MPEPSYRHRAALLMAVPLAMALATAVAALVATPPAALAQATSPSATSPPGVAPADTPSSLDSPLRPGDLVRLTVWREPDFTGEYPVDASGTVILPRIGAVRVLDRPTAELRREILDGLARYLRNPSIDVVFLRRITIYGAVQDAGLYPVDPTMTILDALALAGGSRPDGRLDRIRLLRGGEEIATIRTTATRIDELPIRSGDQIFVPEQSWARRNSGLLATFLSAGVTLAVAFIYTSR